MTRPHSIEYLEAHPEAFSAHNYRDAEELYDVIEKLFPKGTPRSYVEQYFGEQRNYYVMGPYEVDKINGTYFILYGYNTPPQKEHLARGIKVRYYNSNDTVHSVGAKIQKPLHYSDYYSENQDFYPKKENK